MVGKVCERCGFIPEHLAQLDVHHKDHNHNNNEPTNLQTLCANCHRLDRVGLLI
jgi:5-methylcytosine-specific restriction endonuclease McrA